MESETKANMGISPAVPVIAPGESGWRARWRAMRALHDREKSRLRQEIARVPGLMALLMKPRNGERWNRQDRDELRQQLRGLSRISLYVTLMALPFTTLTLPLVAWWLDRRSQRRNQRKPAK